MTNGSTLTLQVPLSRPSRPSKTIKRLRGSLAVAVSTRKSDPLVVPMSNASGKSFQNDEVVLGVQDVRVDPNTHQMTLDISIRSNSPAKVTDGFGNSR